MTSITTSGLQLKTNRRWLADTVELISSMRFAISLLTLIAIASIIGTVLKQNEPMPNYVNQFGPFWFEIFDKLSLYSVYSAWWFLLIMAFLVVSTTLCIVRNTPKMLRDMRSWRENVREQSLRNFHHKVEWSSSRPVEPLAESLARRIADDGYQARIVQKENALLIAAKRGSANKWGYIFAHSAIVIICVGGLLDSDLPIRFQQWFGGKTPYSGNDLISQIPAQHRLGQGNPSYRANAFIPEGATRSSGVIPRQSGVLIQELPFAIELKKFTIEHYSTGMPKLFASDVIVHDTETGKQFEAKIKVNEPLIYKGVAVYQSSFDDGGSKLKLRAFPMTGAGRETFAVTGEVGGSGPLQNGGKDTDYAVEWTGFRPFNIENTAENGQDVRAVDANKSFNDKLAAGLDKQLGSGAKNANNKDLKNVGPSVQYKLRDKTGQAREYHNYMQSVLLDGEQIFLAGMRESPNEPFRYLRIPADDKDSVEDWMRLRAALFDTALRARAAERYALRAMPGRDVNDALRDQLRKSALRGMEVFAGNDQGSGFAAVAKFLEQVPEAEQQKAAEVFLKILNGSLWELLQAAREKEGLPALVPNEKHERYMRQALNALSDAAFYGAPVYLQLQEFEEVKASVLQVTRSPGKNVVYLGCLLLVLGVFAMFYIRERRMWIWLKQDSDGRTHALMALSTQRRTLDFEKEFEALKARLSQAG